jgi:hypothetical protein
MTRHALALLLFLCAALGPARASAAPASDGGDDGGADAAADADTSPEGIQPTTTPDNLGCAAGRRGSTSGSLAVAGLALGVAAIAGARRARRARLAAIACLACLTSLASSASAEEAAPADDGDRRWLTLAYNPFTLQASRYGANVEVLLASHHVLAGTLYYANTLTNEDSFKNRFRGVGGELGYRYYTGTDGPRGLFFGPSLLLAALEAVPARSASTSFENYGVALDLGYQAIVADRWVVGLGGGLQYSRPTTTFPQQELPASVYANPGVRPRLLLALGVAF